MQKPFNDSGSPIDSPRRVELFSDFTSYVSGTDFSSVLTASVTAATSDSFPGVVTLTDVPAVANDEAYIVGASKFLDISQAGAIVFECAFRYAEQNTAYLNLIAGLTSNTTSGILATGSGGPRTTSSNFLVSKAGNATTLQPYSCYSRGSIGTNFLQTLKTDQLPIADNTTWNTIRIEVVRIDSSYVEATYKFNGQPMLDAVRHQPFKHRCQYGTALPMAPVVGFRTGATATNAETIDIDYIYAGQMKD